MSERYVSPHRKPTPEEAEMLVILAEECAEVIKDVAKWLRFGAKDIDPDKPDVVTNDVRMAMEVGDIYEVVRRLQIMNLIHGHDIDAGCRRKAGRLDRYLQNV